MPVCALCRLNFAGVPQQIESEQLGFVAGIFADNIGFSDFTSLNQQRKPYQLAKLALQI